MIARILFVLLLAVTGCTSATLGECVSRADCPSDSLCEFEGTAEAQCSLVCHWNAANCIDGAACFRGALPGRPNGSTLYCRMPCESPEGCPPGLACMRSADAPGTWCLL